VALQPLMQGHVKGRILGAIANLRPIWERGVLDIDVLGTRLQCGQAWHVLPVNFRWIREITPVKLLRLLSSIEVPRYLGIVSRSIADVIPRNIGQHG
jgi:hypothetical protein